MSLMYYLLTETKAVKIKIFGITDQRSLAPFIKGVDESGYVIRDVSGMGEESVVRSLVFELADELKDSKLRDFKLNNGASPYFIGQTPAFWSWFKKHYSQLVKVKDNV